jgi:hypothetical protein
VPGDRLATASVPQVNGIMMFIFGMQMMVQAQYNVFGDQMMPFIFGADAAPEINLNVTRSPRWRRGDAAVGASTREPRPCRDGIRQTQAWPSTTARLLIGSS